MSSDGPVRRFIRDRKPLIPRKKILAENIDDAVSIEDEIEAKKAEWRKEGYSESMIANAEKLARQWVSSMTKSFVPPEYRDEGMRYNIKRGLDAADNWLKSIISSSV